MLSQEEGGKNESQAISFNSHVHLIAELCGDLIVLGRLIAKELFHLKA